MLTMLGVAVSWEGVGVQLPEIIPVLKNLGLYGTSPTPSMSSRKTFPLSSFSVGFDKSVIYRYTRKEF